MRFQGLDLNLLVALDALLTEMNVSVAAERVNLSQSAMSGALNRLRGFFKDDPLVISGHKMVLTARAEALMRPVREALLQIRTTITTPPEFDARTATRHFSVLASDYVRQVVIAETFRRMVKDAPNMSFTVAPIFDDPIGQLLKGTVDVLMSWCNLGELGSPRMTRLSYADRDAPGGPKSLSRNGYSEKRPDDTVVAMLEGGSSEDIDSFQSRSVRGLTAENERQFSPCTENHRSVSESSAVGPPRVGRAGYLGGRGL